jgi:hypothetical protein
MADASLFHAAAYFDTQPAAEHDAAPHAVSSDTSLQLAAVTADELPADKGRNSGVPEHTAHKLSAARGSRHS